MDFKGDILIGSKEKLAAIKSHLEVTQGS